MEKAGVCLDQNRNLPGRAFPREPFNYHHQSARQTTETIIQTFQLIHTDYTYLLLIKHLARSLMHIIIYIIRNHLLWTEYHYFEKS